MTIDELLGLLDMQEEILQFSHFTRCMGGGQLYRGGSNQKKTSGGSQYPSE